MNLKRANKEALLDRANKRDQNKLMYRDYDSKALGMKFTIKKLSIDRICDILDMAADDSMRASIEVNKQLIYESIPLLQDQEIQAAYGCVEPYDVVLNVLEDNMNEMNNICQFILSLYGLDNLNEDIKN